MEVPDIGPTSRRWDNEEWAKGQLISHLNEVGDLIDRNDDHYEAELADLVMIAAHLVDPDMLRRRFVRFEEKARMD